MNRVIVTQQTRQLDDSCSAELLLKRSLILLAVYFNVKIESLQNS